MKFQSPPILFLTVIVLTLSLPCAGQVLINEYSVSNLESFQDNYQEYEDWFELYNAGTSNVTLEGYFLSDDPDEQYKYEIPSGITIPANGYLRFWASGRNEASGSHIHTSFRLNQTKSDTEHVVFSDPFGTILQDFQLEITQLGHSRGRVSDGSGNWGIFTNPTPNSSNNSATSYLRYAERPVLNQEAGFYLGPVTVSITTTEPNSVIRYTTTGHDVSTSSTTYSGPIDITSTIILKAKVYSTDPNVLPGLMEFSTYFINVSHQLVVMSGSADALTNLLNGNSSLRPKGTIEYFDLEGTRTTYGYGEYNEHGQDSWVHDQRSIDYIMRDECGYNNALKGKLFSLSDREEFQRVILRASGDDNYPGIDTSAHMRDMIVQKSAQRAGMHLDVRKAERCIFYANGQYWGVYSIREKVPDHDYTDFYYDQGKYELYYLMLWGGTWAEYGGQQAFNDWNTLHDFIKYNDMSQEGNYQYVISQYDYKSLVDYVLINSFVVCSDWINWNVGWWRGLNPEGGHQKWGYILWDEDATFGHYINYTGVPGQHPYVSPCFPETITSDPEEHILVLNKLRNNPEFDNYYINRYVDLLNSAFHPDTMIGLVDSVEAMLLPEMPGHVARWGGSVAEWQNNVQKIRNFINNRYNYIPGGLNSCYNLNGPYDLKINVVPADKGKVVINSLELENFPWSGFYFGGIDLHLEALQVAPEYEFDHWEIENGSIYPSDTTHHIILNISQMDSITVHYTLSQISDSLVINEINYNSSDDFNPEDWVELYNPHTYDLNLSSWEFKDEDDEHVFTFPAGTIISADDYIVLVRDSAAFQQHFPFISNFVGQMGYGFSGGGELLRLFNPDGLLVDTVHYDDVAPWPLEPDGNGPTLELINPYWDNALSESWAASTEHGTPGAINGNFVATPELTEEIFVVEIFPNPFEKRAILRISGKEIADGTLKIYDLYGNTVKVLENLQTGETFIDRSGLESGVYTYRFSSLNENCSAAGKLMIK